MTARMHLPRKKGPAWGCRVGVLGWVDSRELWSLSPSPCHWQPGDVDLHGWVPAVPPPCSNRPFVFQIYWPPRPGQMEECFQKGKDPGVSFSVLCSELGDPLVPDGSSHVGAVPCHLSGLALGLREQLILVQEGN